jgi:hypothetical protein
MNTNELVNHTFFVMLIKDNLHYFLVTRKLMASRIMMMMIEVKWDNI